MLPFWHKDTFLLPQKRSLKAPAKAAICTHGTMSGCANGVGNVSYTYNASIALHYDIVVSTTALHCIRICVYVWWTVEKWFWKKKMAKALNTLHTTREFDGEVASIDSQTSVMDHNASNDMIVSWIRKTMMIMIMIMIKYQILNIDMFSYLLSHFFLVVSIVTINLRTYYYHVYVVPMYQCFVYYLILARILELLLGNCYWLLLKQGNLIRIEERLC